MTLKKRNSNGNTPAALKSILWKCGLCKQTSALKTRFTPKPRRSSGFATQNYRSAARSEPTASTHRPLFSFRTCRTGPAGGRTRTGPGIQIWCKLKKNINLVTEFQSSLKLLSIHRSIAVNSFVEGELLLMLLLKLIIIRRMVTSRAILIKYTNIIVNIKVGKNNVSKQLKVM